MLCDVEVSKEQKIFQQRVQMSMDSNTFLKQRGKLFQTLGSDTE